MSTYEVNTSNEDGDYAWTIVETTSGLVIGTFLFLDDAETIAKGLNKGNGFDGWTPPFFLNSGAAYLDINQEFDAL